MGALGRLRRLGSIIPYVCMVWYVSKHWHNSRLEVFGSVLGAFGIVWKRFGNVLKRLGKVLGVFWTVLTRFGTFECV